MKSLRKRILAMAAVVAVSGLMMASVAGAADKLIVLDNVTPTPNSVFKVTTTGTSGGLAGVNIAAPLYPMDVAVPGGALKSTLHFSAAGADSGGWLTSVAGNNFFISSGAVYDGTAGGWIQKDTSGKSVFFGSGAAGFRAYLNQGATVGGLVTANQVMLVDYSGNLIMNGGIQANSAGTAVAQPDCDSTKRGMFWNVQGAAGVKDTLQVCTKDAVDAYAWRTLW